MFDAYAPSHSQHLAVALLGYVVQVQGVPYHLQLLAYCPATAMHLARVEPRDEMRKLNLSAKPFRIIRDAMDVLSSVSVVDWLRAHSSSRLRFVYKCHPMDFDVVWGEVAGAEACAGPGLGSGASAPAAAL